MKNTFSFFHCAAIVACLSLCSCQSAKTVKTTTTRMGIAGQETVTVETPFVDPMDAALAEAMKGVMQ